MGKIPDDIMEEAQRRAESALLLMVRNACVDDDAAYRALNLGVQIRHIILETTGLAELLAERAEMRKELHEVHNELSTRDLVASNIESQRDLFRKALGLLVRAWKADESITEKLWEWCSDAVYFHPMHPESHPGQPPTPGAQEPRP